MKSTKPKIAVVIKEGRHTDIVARYPNTIEGKRRAHHRWSMVYTAIQEQIEKAPDMLRAVKVDIAIV